MARKAAELSLLSQLGDPARWDPDPAVKEKCETAAVEPGANALLRGMVIMMGVVSVPVGGTNERKRETWGEQMGQSSAPGMGCRRGVP